MENTIYFLCNGQNPKCKDRCLYSECMHTTDPKYAKNFSVEEDKDGNLLVTENLPGNRGITNDNK